jgi:parallel beta-helix repeat protein
MNNIVFNCNLSKNVWEGVEISGYSRFNNISFCNITKNDHRGAFLGSSDNVIFNSNIINNSWDGVRITSSNNNVINSSIKSNGENGIYINYQSNNIINSEIINNTIHGIAVESVSNILIDNCKILMNTNGIDLYNPITQPYHTNVTIKNSNISRNYKGIDGFRYNLCYIENCIIENNTQQGIYLRYSKYNLVKYNLFKDNEYGFYADPGASNNDIFHNNFISNTIQAFSSNENNFFNQQYPIGGNYWGDYEDMWIDEFPILDQYSGVWQMSEGRDCIGDFEYDDGLSALRDQYPFIYYDGWYPPQVSPIIYGPQEPVVTTGSFSLTWDDLLNVANYEIEEAGTDLFLNPIRIYSGENNFYNAINKPDGTYYYRVQAQNLFGNSSWSNVVKVIADRLPDIPSGLIVEQIITGNELKITWNDNYYDTINYTIWSNKAGAWKPLINITHPGTEFIDTNLTDGIRYNYKLQAWDKRGLCSGFTSVASNISIDIVAPSIPENFKITEVTIDTINLSWSPSPEPDLVGYHIFKASSADGVFKKINIDSINGTSYMDSVLSSNTTYFYKLLAHDEVPNYSYYTEIINETTLPILDLTNPTVISYLPIGTNVFPYPKIKVAFSEYMNKDSVNRSFSIIPYVSGEYSWSIDDRTFTFDPDEKLTEGQTYNVTISTKAIDLAGNPLLSPLTWNFTVGDFTSPEILDHSPNGTDVPVDKVIEVVFSEELDLEYITPSAILLKDQNGSFVNGTISYENLTLTFTPTMDLEPGSVYTVLVNKLLKDPAGNDLGTEFSWEFTTIEEPTKPVTEDEEPETFDYSAVGIGIIILIIIIIVLLLFLRKSGILGSKPPPKLVWDDEMDEE